MTHVEWDDDEVMYEVDDEGHTKYVCKVNKISKREKKAINGTYFSFVVFYSLNPLFVQL